jgi:type II secretory pathway pseudopilin PulG
MHRVAGFTLVEVLISGAIAAISLVAIVSAVRKGQELDIADMHRRRARVIIDSCLESSRYQINDPAFDFNALAIGTQPVVVDPTPGFPAGALSASVSADSASPALHRKVAITVRWTEGTHPDSICIEKILVDL